MGTRTYFVALPFKRAGMHLTAGEAQECACAETAAAAAEAFAASFGGAVAFSRTIDPELGTCRRAELIRSLGEVPKLGYLLDAA